MVFKKDSNILPYNSFDLKINKIFAHYPFNNGNDKISSSTVIIHLMLKRIYLSIIIMLLLKPIKTFKIIYEHFKAGDRFLWRQ